jgi:hypothetical protein
VDNIEDFTMDDFEIKDYKSHPAVSMVMAVWRSGTSWISIEILNHNGVIFFSNFHRVFL